MHPTPEGCSVGFCPPLGAEAATHTLVPLCIWAQHPPSRIEGKGRGPAPCWHLSSHPTGASDAIGLSQHWWG